MSQNNMFRCKRCDILQAFKSEELLSYQADHNIIKGHKLLGKAAMFLLYIKTLCSVTGTDTWETFSENYKNPETPVASIYNTAVELTV